MVVLNKMDLLQDAGSDIKSQLLVDPAVVSHRAHAFYEVLIAYLCFCGEGRM